MSGLEARVITARLLTVLAEALEGASGPATYFVDNQADSGLFGALARVDAADASRTIGARSIAAHVHHVVFAMGASADWMAGDRSPRDWSESWRVSTVDEEEWAFLVEELSREYHDLRAEIEKWAGTDEDAFVEAVGAIAHVAYHLGSVWQKLAAIS